MEVSLETQTLKSVNYDPNFLNHSTETPVIAEVPGPEEIHLSKNGTIEKIRKVDTKLFQTFRIFLPENCLPFSMKKCHPSGSSTTIPISEVLVEKLNAAFGHVVKNMAESLMYLSVVFMQKLCPFDLEILTESGSDMFPNIIYYFEKLDSSELTFLELVQELRARNTNPKDNGKFNSKQNAGQNHSLDICPNKRTISLNSILTETGSEFLRELLAFVTIVCESPSMRLQQAYLRSSLLKLKIVDSFLKAHSFVHGFSITENFENELSIAITLKPNLEIPNCFSENNGIEIYKSSKFIENNVGLGWNAEKLTSNQVQNMALLQNAFSSTKLDPTSELALEILRSDIRNLLKDCDTIVKIDLTPDDMPESLDSSDYRLSEAQLALAQVWSDILEIPLKGIKNSDNFLDLGGSSLSTSDVLQKVEKYPMFKGLKVYSLFFDRVTLSEAAVLIKAKRERFDQYKFLVKRSLPDLCPLSYQQEQIWLHLQAPQTPPTLFNESGRIMFHMDVDFNTFKAAFKLLVQRNSILTLTIHQVNGKVFQKMNPDQELPLSFVDLSHLVDLKERNTAARAIVFAEAQKPMDFQRGPLHKHILIRQNSNLTELVSVSHHLITDGAGFSIFEAELRLLIQHCSAGSMQTLPPPGLQYVDFALWQRETFEIGSNSELSDFWKTQLEGLIPLDIPIDISRQSAGNKLTCSRYLFQLRPEVTALIKANIETPYKTTFLILTTALNILLARYTDQTDISVLTAKHGRNHGKLAGMIGHFVNLLVIRNQVSEDLSFSQFLASVQKCLQKAYEHEDYPFQHVFNNLELKLEEKPEFFKVAISMVPRQREDKSKGLSSDYLNVKNKHAKYDLLLFFDDRDDMITCCIEYNSDLYSKSRIDRMSHHFQNILEQGLTKPNDKIRNINILSIEEVNTIFDFSHAGQIVEFDTGSSTLIELFEIQVVCSPENIAISEPDKCRQLTYRSLNQEANKLRTVLSEKLSKTDKVVAVLLPNGVDFIVSSLAILKSGRACLPLGIENPKQRLEFMLNDFGNPLVISDRVTVSQLGLSHTGILFIDDLDILIEQTTASDEVMDPLPHDIAYAFYTSGTTGIPKAVLLDHASLTKVVEWSMTQFDMTGHDRGLLFTNPAFDVSLAEIWPCLGSGGTLVCPPTDFRVNIPELRAWIRRERVSIVYMTTVVAEAFYTAAPEQFSDSLRWVISGGEKLGVLPNPGVSFRLAHCYGVTEASVTSTIYIVPREAELLQCIPIGKPLPNVRIYILNSHMQQCPVGVYGELYIGGQSLSRGYHERSNLNSLKFITHSGERLYKSGDIGRWLEDGNISLRGRSDNQIKIRGHRIELDEIEEILKTIPIVRGAVVIQNERENTIHAFLALKNSCNEDQFNANEMRAFAAAQLPHWAVPNSFTLVSEFCVTVNGKVDRKRILSEYKATQLSLRRNAISEIPTALNPIEQAVAMIWSLLLKVPLAEINLKSNFFELGGNSLLIGEFIGKLQEKYLEFTKVSTGTLFNNPTIESFVGAIENRDTDSGIQAGSSKTFLDYLDQDLKLNIESIPLYSEKFAHKANTILLTGATGYLGSHLLHDLLKLSETITVYCIVRASNEEEAYERMERALKAYELDIDPCDLSNRVKCLAGDISKFKFGLGPPEYSQMAKTVDAVYHCASEVHFLKSYSDLQGHNVQGTKEIIQFVTQRRPKILHYISTLGVLELDQSSSADEIKLTSINEVAEGSIGYLQTKWVAEKLVWKAIDKGVRAIVYRPGLVGCSSERPIVNQTDTVGLLLRYCHELGYYPDIDWISPYGTVDFTSRAIIQLSQGFMYGRVYHVFQNTISLNEMLNLNPGELSPLSLEAWRKLSDTSEVNPVCSMLFRALADRVSSDTPLLEFSQRSHDSFSNWNTVEGLLGSGLSFDVNKEDVERYLNLLLKKQGT